MEDILYDIYLKSTERPFDDFCDYVQSLYDAPVSNLKEMRDRESKKIKGDLFEEFCILYLLRIKNYKKVYLLKDVPERWREKFSIRRRDMGIDAVGKDKYGNYCAIQIKYRKRKERNVLSWKMLSTFYALASKTGPWDKLVVMTNQDSVSRQGEKTEQDVSICYKSFRNISKCDWLILCGREGETLDSDNDDEEINKKELRKRRTKYFDKLFKEQDNNKDTK